MTTIEELVAEVERGEAIPDENTTYLLKVLAETSPSAKVVDMRAPPGPSAVVRFCLYRTDHGNWQARPA